MGWLKFPVGLAVDVTLSSVCKDVSNKLDQPGIILVQGVQEPPLVPMIELFAFDISVIASYQQYLRQICLKDEELVIVRYVEDYEWPILGLGVRILGLFLTQRHP